MEWLSISTIVGFVSSNAEWFVGGLIALGILKAPQPWLYKIGFKIGQFLRVTLRQRAGDEGGDIATTLYGIIHGIADGLKLKK